MPNESITCVSCGAELTGKFCAECGEQRLNPNLRSLGHIAKDIVEDLTSVDGKLWRTLRTLFLQPGQLDYDYHRGKRISYLKPITLFFLINVLFIAFATISDFYINFYDQMTLQPYSPYLKAFMENYLSAHEIDKVAFAQNYDQLVKVLARSIIILQVPVFAFIAFWLFLGRGYYASDHFIFSLNLHAWLMIWIVVATYPAYFMAWLCQLVGIEMSQSRWYFLLLALGKILYLFRASMVAYQFKWWQSLWRLPLLVIAYAVSHTIFRLIQFLITASLVEV